MLMGSLPRPIRNRLFADILSCELHSKLLKGGYIGDYIGDYYRAY